MTAQALRDACHQLRGEREAGGDGAQSRQAGGEEQCPSLLPRRPIVSHGAQDPGRVLRSSFAGPPVVSRRVSAPERVVRCPARHPFRSTVLNSRLARSFSMPRDALEPVHEAPPAQAPRIAGAVSAAASVGGEQIAVPRRLKIDFDPDERDGEDAKSLLAQACSTPDMSRAADLLLYTASCRPSHSSASRPEEHRRFHFSPSGEHGRRRGAIANRASVRALGHHELELQPIPFVYRAQPPLPGQDPVAPARPLRSRRCQLVCRRLVHRTVLDPTILDRRGVCARTPGRRVMQAQAKAIPNAAVWSRHPAAQVWEPVGNLLAAGLRRSIPQRPEHASIMASPASLLRRRRLARLSYGFRSACGALHVTIPKHTMGGHVVSSAREGGHCCASAHIGRLSLRSGWCARSPGARLRPHPGECVATRSLVVCAPVAVIKRSHPPTLVRDGAEADSPPPPSTPPASLRACVPSSSHHPSPPRPPAAPTCGFLAPLPSPSPSPTQNLFNLALVQPGHRLSGRTSYPVCLTTVQLAVAAVSSSPSADHANTDTLFSPAAGKCSLPVHFFLPPAARMTRRRRRLPRIMYKRLLRSLRRRLLAFSSACGAPSSAAFASRLEPLRWRFFEFSSACGARSCEALIGEQRRASAALPRLFFCLRRATPLFSNFFVRLWRAYVSSRLRSRLRYRPRPSQLAEPANAGASPSAARRLPQDFLSPAARPSRRTCQHQRFFVLPAAHTTGAYPKIRACGARDPSCAASRTSPGWRTGTVQRRARDLESGERTGKAPGTGLGRKEHAYRPR
ncbi:hypothetical protein AURDEDRAFT_189045 [Auricularia subglabra TFB-10046 SS5]|uniref:Uncharacterized protein n=1 Tax=Auricularia subglabra (strain TFB-10046 / SS5) TaxID=717982 RepID=J0D4S4_AURST|nr:hypothetical protein AURDEDRAFT_189045 [Auricularia subglabra TFB-10046 SS5]